MIARADNTELVAQLAAILDLQPADLQLRRVPGGQSNRTWRATAHERSWFVRVGGSRDSELGVDRHAEHLALQVAARADLAPHLLHVDEATGLLITAWLEGQAWTQRDAGNSGNLVRVATALQKLHALDLPPGMPRRDLAANVRRLVETVQAGELTQLDLDSLRAGVAEREALAASVTLKLCHYDLHCENIIDDGSLHFVDWEYAAAGDPRVDLAAFVTYHDLDAQHAQQLLEAYDARVDRAEFAAICWLFDALHLSWLTVAGLTPVTRPRFDALRSRLAL